MARTMKLALTAIALASTLFVTGCNACSSCATDGGSPEAAPPPPPPPSPEVGAPVPTLPPPPPPSVPAKK